MKPVRPLTFSSPKVLTTLQSLAQRNLLRSGCDGYPECVSPIGEYTEDEQAAIVEFFRMDKGGPNYTIPGLNLPD